MARKPNVFTRFLQLVLDKASIEKTKKDTQKALKDATDPRPSEQNLGRIERGFNKARLVALAFAAAMVGALAAALRKVTTESIAAQKALAQQEAVLRSTGMAAGRTAEQLQAQAAALQKVTTFSDDAVMAAQNLLLTFTKLRGQEFDKTVEVTLDLATAMGTDASNAALQLGKALQDPVTGLTALRRAGVSFSEAQKETIKDLVETNRLAEAQRLILAELEVQFGGSAEAARNTLGGALQGLSNAWGDLFEVTRESSGGIIDAINAIADALPRVRTGIDNFLFNIQSMGAGAAVQLQQLNVIWLKFWDGLGKFGRNLLFGVEITPEGVVDQGTSKRLQDAEALLERMKVAYEEVIAEMRGGATATDTFNAALAGFNDTLADTNATLEDAERKRLDLLLAGRELGLLTTSQTEELVKMTADFAARLKDGNLALEERVRLARMLKDINESFLGKRAVRERDVGKVFPRPQAGPIVAGDVHANEPVPEPSEVAEDWTEAFGTIADEGRAAAMIIGEVLAGTGEGFSALLKRIAPGKAAENFARALEAAGAGLARFVLYGDGAAAVAGAKAAALHTAAGLAWLGLGAAGGGGGRGGAATAGGLPGGGSFGAREPAGRGADRFAPSAPPIITIYMDPLDPSNGVYQSNVGSAVVKFFERRGNRITGGNLS